MRRISRQLNVPLIAFMFACFALAPQVRAVCQDACLTNNNTVQGDDALVSLTTGADNTAVGFNVLKSNTTGVDNTAIGYQALLSNTTGGNNTSNGFEALYFNTTGARNTATGAFALLANNTGSNNTATGLEALFSNGGSNNTATGTFALFDNTTGFNNTATGFSALLNGGSGNNNTADGQNALRGTVSGITGSNNTAAGVEALQNDTSGNGNTGTGVAALESNSTGGFNTGTGFSALFSNTTGSNNTAAGLDALRSNTTGSNNIALGQSAGANLTTGNGNIDIGNAGVAGEAKTIRIGTTGTHTNAFIAGISGVTVPTGVAVIVDSTGHLGTTTSSARYKDNIRPMDKTSEAILALKPVTFRYKHDLDPESIPQFGLVAEDVEKVNPDLVARDEQGKPYTVRYEAVNAMLLNEFLKEHQTVQELKKQVAELTAGLQKVSAQLEVRKQTPQMASR